MSTSPSPDAASGRPARVVVAVVRDLMDRSRLSRDDLEIRFVAADELAGAVAATSADRVVIDLAVPGVLGAVGQLGGRSDTEEPERPPVIAYGPHVDRDRLAEARQAGCDQVLARSAFFTRWPDVG